MPVSQPRTVFRLRTVFGAILLTMLLLPLTGMHFFRIYENELVRQTESELIAQAVFISAFYKDALAAQGPKAEKFGVLATMLEVPLDERYRPYPPQLDLRKAEILPPRPDSALPLKPADPIAAAIGQKLNPMLAEAKLSMLSSIRVLDYQGVVVSGSSEIGGSLADVEEVAQALQGHYVSVLRKRIPEAERPALASISRGTDTRVFIAMPIVVDDYVTGLVYISRSPRNVLKSLYEERQSVFAVAVLMLLITTGVATLLAYTIGKPLGALTRHAQQLTLGTRASDRLTAPPIAELVSLAESFEQMSSTIEARSEYIRSFAMHVAHEFKTPLTAIQGAVELLHDHPHDMKPDQRKRFLENIMKDTDRLKTLVSRLLDLARADVMQAGQEDSSVTQILNALKDRYAGQLEISVPDNAPTAAIASDILETVFVNLAENSLQHGGKNLAVMVTAEGDSLQLDVRDDGSGVSEGNAGRLFTPFFTTRRDSGGTGLGLAITRSLLKAHGGDIAYIPGRPGAHFRVTLRAV
ncbi:MAG: sensor histidine kinase [Alphaproteobacteria bacterium]